MSKSNFTCIEAAGSSRWTRRPLNMASKCNLYKSWSYFEGNALAGNEIHSNHKTTYYSALQWTIHSSACLPQALKGQWGISEPKWHTKLNRVESSLRSLTQAQDMIVHMEKRRLYPLSFRNPCVNGKSLARSSSLLRVMYYSNKRAKSL